MNKRDYLKREAEGVSKRHEIEYAVNWDFDFDEDRFARCGKSVTSNGGGCATYRVLMATAVPRIARGADLDCIAIEDGEE